MRYYEWLLMYGEDDSMKGDFTIDARGSSVLVERDAQAQILTQYMVGISVNPAYGLDPELVMKEALKSQRFDAEKLLLSEDKKAEMAKRPPPVDPRIEVAKINSQTKIKLEEMDDKDQADHAAAQAQLQMSQQQFDSAMRQWEKNVDLALEQAKLQAGRELSTNEQKVVLAREAMKLRTQVALAMKANRSAPQVANPSMEPQGKAKPGSAFQA